MRVFTSIHAEKQQKCMLDYHIQNQPYYYTARNMEINTNHAENTAQSYTLHGTMVL